MFERHLLNLELGGQPYSVEIDLHRANCAQAMIIYPGYGGDKDGYNQKYVTLGDHLSGARHASIIRFSNSDLPLLTNPNRGRCQRYREDTSPAAPKPNKGAGCTLWDEAEIDGQQAKQLPVHDCKHWWRDRTDIAPKQAQPPRHYCQLQS